MVRRQAEQDRRKGGRIRMTRNAELDRLIQCAMRRNDWPGLAWAEVAQESKNFRLAWPIVRDRSKWHAVFVDALVSIEHCMQNPNDAVAAFKAGRYTERILAYWTDRIVKGSGKKRKPHPFHEYADALMAKGTRQTVAFGKAAIWFRANCAGQRLPSRAEYKTHRADLRKR